MNTLRPVERAYIAGLFDGEGCVYFHKGEKPRITITQKDPKVLQWVQEITGEGTLRQNGSGCWRLWFIKESAMQGFIEAVYKHSIVKRDKLRQARRWLEKEGKWH